MAVRFSEKEYRDLLGEEGTATRKYRNKPVYLDGHRFDSEHERDIYAELKILERAGEISELKLQPAFELVPAVRRDGKPIQRAITYKADFSYMQDGELKVLDAKGVKTDVYKLKKKLMLALLGIEIEEV